MGAKDIKTLIIIGASALSFAVRCYGQAPAGWESQPGLEKKMPGEGKWFVHWRGTDAVAARVIEKEIALKITDLETLLKIVNTTNMKVSSRVVPTGLRYPCLGFIGTTTDNFPAEMYVIITHEHVYSVFAMTLSSLNLPSKIGFSLADWQSAISADKKMAPGDQARYETILKDVKSKLDSASTVSAGK
jgi:hypothetical protein